MFNFSKFSLRFYYQENVEESQENEVKSLFENMLILKHKIA